MDVDMFNEQLIGASVRYDLSKFCGVVTGISALCLGGHAYDSWPRNLKP